MTICYVNPDGSHVRGCDPHQGHHPWDWCRDERAKRTRRMQELDNYIYGGGPSSRRTWDWYDSTMALTIAAAIAIPLIAFFAAFWCLQ